MSETLSRSLKRLAMLAALSGFLGPGVANAQQVPSGTLLFSDSTGRNATFSGSTTAGSLDLTSPFFQPIGQSFGGNDRSCASCHRPEQGWTVTPLKVQNLFELTGGLDPLFNPVDGTNAPNADTSTVEARRLASSLLLNRGLIRVALPVKPTFDFEVVAVTVPGDGSFPSDFAQNALDTKTISVFRRPPSTGNVSFLTDVMWDGRETTAGNTLNDNLISQALHAAVGHLQASGLPTQPTSLTAEQRAMFQSIVNFETNTFEAQLNDIAEISAGDLNTDGSLGGPGPLFTRPPALFQGGVFNLYQAWNQLTANSTDMNFIEVQSKKAIARGETLFNTRVFTTNLVGQATCSTCHSNRAAGNSATQRRFNLGLSVPNATVNGIPANTVFPVYTLRRKVNGERIMTTDPGHILITGRWGVGDGDTFHVPQLRGLASRPPYFHGGQAPTLTDVVRFYNARFAINLTAQEQQDLVSFLRSL